MIGIKKKTLFIFFTTLLLLMPLFLKADTEAIISGSSVRLREGPSTSTSSLYTFGINTSIQIVDNNLVPDTGGGCPSNWYKISYKDKIGYVCSKYVSFRDITYDGINVVDYEARVNANNVTVRKSNSSSSTSLGTLSLGVNVKILEETNDTKNSCSKMYKIQYYGNQTGYICSNYITKKQDIILNDETYKQELLNKGFIESYIPYLTYLHNKFPAWDFIAKKTGKSFSTAVDREEGKNYMQTTNDNYRVSSTPSEGKSWYTVNSQVIAFYMDPRNWLSEERIFMFEKQDYSEALESIYPQMVKSIFGSGNLADEKYTIPIVNAGKTNKISPLLIAARIRQEVGANGSDSTNGTTFTFKGQEYSGYYNFFNIGAYEEVIDGIKYNSVVRGLAYAAKLINRSGEVWNNIETSITEGSSFLANGYVTNGQGTLYYQKFNVSPDAYYSSFTHQYQTNIQAPSTEGNKIYNSYKSYDLLNQPLLFEIPVYDSMPPYTSLPNSGDTTNTLSSLNIEGYAITPLFDKDVLSYEAYVPSSVNKVKITATSDSNLSVISGTGEIELQDNETLITITNTSESGNIKKYTITIYKTDDNLPVAALLGNSSFVLNDTYMTKIKNNSTVSDIKNRLLQNGAKKVIITNASGATINDNETIGTGFKITLSTSIETKELTMSVNGDTSGDGQVTILDLLQIQKHIKGVSRLSGPYALSADTSGDNNVTILDLLQVQKHIKKDKLL